MIPSTRAITWSASRTSHRRARSSPGDGSRAHTTTVAPASLSTSAIPLPTPRVPPVTRAKAPSSASGSGMPATLPSNCLVTRGGPVAGIRTDRREDAIAVVTLDYPPVNALPVQGWFDLADALRAAGRDPDVHAVVLRAEGRGFCAGVDIKEMQRTTGFDALLGANRGCYEAFGAVYDC